MCLAGNTGISRTLTAPRPTRSRRWCITRPAGTENVRDVAEPAAWLAQAHRRAAEHGWNHDERPVDQDDEPRNPRHQGGLPEQFALFRDSRRVRAIHGRTVCA